MGGMGVQMCKVPRSNQEWCLSLKLGDTDLRATALQEMKNNNTLQQKKCSVEKGCLGGRWPVKLGVGSPNPFIHWRGECLKFVGQTILAE